MIKEQVQEEAQEDVLDERQQYRQECMKLIN